MASTAAAAAFYTTFQGLKADVTTALDPTNPAGASAALAALRAALHEARASLPAYDQRSYDLQVKELEGRLASLRADKPKARFAFKRAKPAPSASASASTSASPAPAQTAAPISAPTPPPATTYTLSSRRAAHLTPADYAPRGSYTLTLADLTDCVVDLRPTATTPHDTVLTSLHARGLERCVVLAPILAGSAMLSSLRSCAVAIGAQQFRLHASRDCGVLLYVGSLPVIEHCEGIAVGAYPASLGEGGGSRHAEVQDFDWVRPGPSPHWRLLDREESERLDAAMHEALGTGAQAIQSIPCIQHTN